MEISIRDEKGQAIVEYILVLVVAVSIILGGMYQLNSAFKTWANNYFGNYLSCLLETGDLPTISGSGGDSGICNQFFKPFSLSDGRPLLPKAKAAAEPDKKQNSTSTKEASSGGRGGGGGRGSDNTEFSRGANHSGPNEANGKNGAGKSSEQTNTGNTSVSNYGSYNTSRSSGNKTKILLDTSFAMQSDRESQSRRQIASVPPKNYTGSAGQKTIVHFAQKPPPDPNSGPSAGFTIASFLRYLIIAAIILALVIFLGGQGLQIGKSMD